MSSILAFRPYCRLPSVVSFGIWSLSSLSVSQTWPVSYAPHPDQPYATQVVRTALSLHLVLLLLLYLTYLHFVEVSLYLCWPLIPIQSSTEDWLRPHSAEVDLPVAGGSTLSNRWPDFRIQTRRYAVGLCSKISASGAGNLCLLAVTNILHSLNRAKSLVDKQARHTNFSRLFRVFQMRSMQCRRLTLPRYFSTITGKRLGDSTPHPAKHLA